MMHSKPQMILRLVGVILFCLLLALGGPGALAGSGVSQITRGAPAVATRYVATYGSDAGPNDCLNQAAPCLTIGHAVTEAGFGDTLRIAEGSYLETLNIDRPLHLEGGYQDGTWSRDIALYETIIDASNSRDVPGDWDGDVIMDPAVIAVPGGYRLAYTGGNDFYPWGVGMVDSTDGVTWNKYAGNPVLTPPGGSAWDNFRRSRVTLLLDGGVYKMWYVGPLAV